MAAISEQDDLEDLVQRLRGRLLDLTPRNRILNYRHPPKDCLRIVDVALAAVFDTLARDGALEFEPVPTPSAQELEDYWRAMGEPGRKDRPSAEDYAKYLGWRTVYALPLDDDDRPAKQLRSRHYALDQEASLRRIRNTARQVERDLGAQLLFLAFGFVEWSEPREGSSSGQFLAPLLLVPVQLDEVPRGAQRAFRLRRGRGEIEINPVLLRKLEVDFGVQLPSLAEETDFAAWFRRIERALADRGPLSLRRFLTLGLFHFGGYSLWADLDPKHWQEGKGPAAAPLVRQVFGAEPIAEVGGGVPRDGDALAKLVDLELPLVLDADCSQGRALAYALAGQTMVIEGPPGTGKSQTITNLIAAALAAGKKVLFVSAKRPALDVVLRRLAQAGLDTFCLDLHGENATVAHVLERIRSARKDREANRPSNVLPNVLPVSEERATIWQELEKIRNMLLYKWAEEPAWKLFLRAGELKLRAERAGVARFVETLALDTRGAEAEAGRSALTGAVRAFSELGCAPSVHPWRGVNGTQVLAVDRERLVQRLKEWCAKAVELERLKTQLQRAGGSEALDLARLEEALARWAGLLDQLEAARSAVSELGQELGISVPFSAEAVAPIRTIGARARELLGLRLDLQSPSLLDEDCERIIEELSRRIKAFEEAKDALEGLVPWPPSEMVTVEDLRAAARALREKGSLSFLSKMSSGPQPRRAPRGARNAQGPGRGARAARHRARQKGRGRRLRSGPNAAWTTFRRSRYGHRGAHAPSSVGPELLRRSRSAPSGKRRPPAFLGCTGTAGEDRQANGDIRALRLVR